MGIMYRRGVGFGRKVAVGGSSDALATIGAMTLQNAGARVVSGATDGTYSTYWTIASGVLKRNATAGTPTAGTFEAGAVTITVEASTYDVASAAEFSAVMALGSATLEGKTICGLPGVDLGGTTPGSAGKYTFPVTLAFTDGTGLTIKSRDIDSKASFRRIQWSHRGRIKFDGLLFRDGRQDDEGPTTNAYYMDTGNATYYPYSTIVEIHRSEAHLDEFTYAEANATPVTSLIDGRYYYLASDPILFDWSSLGLAQNGVVSSVNNGTKYRIEAVTGLTDWSAFNGPPSASSGADFVAAEGGAGALDISAYGTVRAWPAEGNGFNATVTNADISAYGTVFLVPKTLDLFGSGGYGNASHNRIMKVYDSHLHHFHGGFTGYYEQLVLERNLLEKCFSNVSSAASRYGDLAWKVKDNHFGATYNGPNTVNPFHADGWQTQVAILAEKTNPWEFIGNTFTDYGGGRSPQTMFHAHPSHDPVAGTNIIHKHNMAIAAQNAFISIEGPGDLSVTQWNTAVYDQTPKSASSQKPKINYNSTAFGEMTVRENVVSGLTSPASPTKTTNNHEWATDSNATYSAVLAGTTFDSDTIASRGDVIAALTPDAGGALVSAYGPNIGAGWYYDYYANPAVTGSMSGIGEGEANEPAAIVPDVFAAGDWAVSDLGSGNGVTVTISALPMDGGDFITGLSYRVDGGSWVDVSGIVSFTIPLVDFPSGAGVAATVAVAARNTVGRGTASSTKSVTPTNAYVPTAARFASGTSMTVGSLGIATGETKALIAFNLRVRNASWPTSNIFTMTSSGSLRLRIYGVSSGTLRFAWYDNTTTQIRAMDITGLSLDTDYGFVCAYDSTNSRMQLYSRANGGAWTASASSTSVTLNAAIGAIDTFNFKVTTTYDIEVGDFFLNLGATLDLSNSTNRDLFLPSADKGSDGSTPLGSAPDFYFSGAVGTWETNDGTAGGMTLTGSISTGVAAWS
jgi:hypothetical protein